jgi:hypothetical protein
VKTLFVWLASVTKLNPCSERVSGATSACRLAVGTKAVHDAASAQPHTCWSSISDCGAAGAVTNLQLPVFDYVVSDCMQTEPNRI